MKGARRCAPQQCWAEFLEQNTGNCTLRQMVKSAKINVKRYISSARDVADIQ